MVRPSDSAAAVEIPGPWTHRYVAANGSRFHVAELNLRPSEPAPLVVLLHGFPEFWWAWRDQLPPLAEAGYRAAAMDLRGYGGSDKPPRGYDPFTLAADVAGVVKALGAADAVVVGHGWGGYVGWAAAVLHRREVSALCAVAAPHPSTMLRSLLAPRRGRRSAAALLHLTEAQLPLVPERRLADPRGDRVGRHLRAWSASPGFPDPAVTAVYQEAIGIWPSAHCALEYHRWLVRSRLRADGRAFGSAMRTPVSQPVLCVAGAADRAQPVGAVDSSRSAVAGPFSLAVLDGVGHFPHEEAPAAFTGVLLEWLVRTGRASG